MSVTLNCLRDNITAADKAILFQFSDEGKGVFGTRSHVRLECAMRSKTGVRRPRQVFGFTPNPAWRLLREIIDLPDPGPRVGERLGLYFK